MEERGIRVVTTRSATATCSRRCADEGGILGGEQSGHVICLRDHVTGDGLAAALLLCGAARGPPAAEAAAVMPRYAQAKENIRVSRTEVPRDRDRGGEGAERGAGRARAACWCAHPARSR